MHTHQRPFVSLKNWALDLLLNFQPLADPFVCLCKVMFNPCRLPITNCAWNVILKRTLELQRHYFEGLSYSLSNDCNFPLKLHVLIALLQTVIINPNENSKTLTANKFFFNFFPKHFSTVTKYQIAHRNVTWKCIHSAEMAGQKKCIQQDFF